jgi:hypothetical protein
LAVYQQSWASSHEQDDLGIDRGRADQPARARSAKSPGIIPAVLLPHLALFHPNHGREKSVLSSSTSAHDVPRMVSNDPASTIIIAETSMFFNIIRPTFMWNVLRWVTLTSGLGHECEYAALIFYHRGVVLGLAFQFELSICSVDLLPSRMQLDKGSEAFFGFGGSSSVLGLGYICFIPYKK